MDYPEDSPGNVDNNKELKTTLQVVTSFGPSVGHWGPCWRCGQSSARDLEKGGVRNVARMTGHNNRVVLPTPPASAVALPPLRSLNWPTSAGLVTREIANLAVIWTRLSRRLARTHDTRTLYAEDMKGGSRSLACIHNLSAHRSLGIFSNSTPRRLWVQRSTSNSVARLARSSSGSSPSPGARDFGAKCTQTARGEFVKGLFRLVA